MAKIETDSPDTFFLVDLDGLVCDDGIIKCDFLPLTGIQIQCSRHNRLHNPRLVRALATWLEARADDMKNNVEDQKI